MTAGEKIRVLEGEFRKATRENNQLEKEIRILLSVLKRYDRNLVQRWNK